MATEIKLPKKLRTIDELNEANEYIFHQQREGKLDGKLADGMNTAIKAGIYLNVKLKMDAFKILAQTRMKKIDMPFDLLPSGLLAAPEAGLVKQQH